MHGATVRFIVVCFMIVFNSKENNYMFRPIAAIFILLQLCSKSIIYMPILRGDAEISSLLGVTFSIFSGMCNSQ